MPTTFSGSYIGANGTQAAPTGGTGIVLPNDAPSYTLTSTAIADGGAGYSHMSSGSITGSPDGGNGGIGIALPSGGHLTNSGKIAGGAGGESGALAAAFGGAGGIGVSFGAYGVLLNHGSIAGGEGGIGSGSGTSGGAGGIAADLAGGGLVINTGRISGGAASPEYNYAVNGGMGGTALLFGAYGVLSNTGTVAGGAGGSSGGDAGGFAGAGAGGEGVELTNNGVIGNIGTISGGQGGSAEIGSYGTVSTGGAGGTAIKLDAGGIVINAGSISGGNGGMAPAIPSFSFRGKDVAGTGGSGIASPDGGVVINTGHITGGNGGSANPESSPFPNPGVAGGSGVNLGGAGVLVNFGDIAGGAAGSAYYLDGESAGGGRGGDGAVLAGGRQMDINFGTISGGAGKPGTGSGLAAGQGGLGVYLVTAGTFVNFGDITGGGNTKTGLGGTGIYLAGGSTLIDAGSIVGADGAAAVTFGNSGASRLILHSTAVFTGEVEAGGSNNVIELAAGKGGALSGLGTEFTGFQTVAVDAGGTWSLSGSIATLRDAGAVDIQGGTSLDITGAVDPASTGIFALTGKASLEIAALLGTNTKIEFLGTSGDLLTLDHPSAFGLHTGAASFAGPRLEDFGAGDSIDLKGIGSAGLNLNYNSASGVLHVSASGGGIVASLQFQNSSLGAGSFHLQSDNTGGSLLTHS